MSPRIILLQRKGEFLPIINIIVTHIRRDAEQIIITRQMHFSRKQRKDHMQKQQIRKYKFLFSFIILFISLTVSFPTYINADAAKKYFAAGLPFGISMETDGVIVSGFTEINGVKEKYHPSFHSGIKAGDVIITVDGCNISSISDLIKAVNDSNGRSVSLTVLRKNEKKSFAVRPFRCEDGILRLGVNVKDSICGIGTLTFIDPDNGSFGGLGHGICDPNTLFPIPMKKGTITDVVIKNIIKGKISSPGEIRGSFSVNRIGTAQINSEFGIFGTLSNYKTDNFQLVEAAQASEVTCGNASIICTLGTDGPQSYSISIESADVTENTDTRNFVIRVTDEKLLSITGGIIQGMSGSPIIQNGKLIGAVTHVFVNEPTKGYGIFIGNMLKNIS